MSDESSNETKDEQENLGAIGEVVDTNSDTVPPAEHGFLEQFEAFSSETFAQLEEVVMSGLERAENTILIGVAAKLIRLAQIHDPEAADKVLSLL